MHAARWITAAIAMTASTSMADLIVMPAAGTIQIEWESSTLLEGELLLIDSRSGKAIATTLFDLSTVQPGDLASVPGLFTAGTAIDFVIQTQQKRLSLRSVQARDSGGLLASPLGEGLWRIEIDAGPGQGAGRGGSGSAEQASFLVSAAVVPEGPVSVVLASLFFAVAPRRRAISH